LYFKLEKMSSELNQPLKNLFVIGDRVLIKPKNLPDKTKTGLLLPPGYKEKEVVQTGYVVKTGPGYPIPMVSEEGNEPWKQNDDKVRYIPLQAQEGDLAIFMQKGAIEIFYNDEKYFIVPQSSILLLERDPFL